MNEVVFKLNSFLCNCNFEKQVDGIHDHVKENLQCILNGDLIKIPENKMNELKKRKLVSKEYVTLSLKILIKKF